VELIKKIFLGLFFMTILKGVFGACYVHLKSIADLPG
jgi:hypothetical protein